MPKAPRTETVRPDFVNETETESVPGTVAVPEPTAALILTGKHVSLDFDFDELETAARLSGDVAVGFRVVPKSVLVGIPFAIIGVTYRNGHLRPSLTEAGVKDPSNYVSVECVVGSQRALQNVVISNQVDGAQTLGVFPNELVVFNDSGTGVCRSLTQLLHDKGLINVGDTANAISGGVLGSSPFDRYHGEWTEGSSQAERGFRIDKGRPPILLCPRGLRVSEYRLDGATEDSYTYYVA